MPRGNRISGNLKISLSEDNKLDKLTILMWRLKTLVLPTFEYGRYLTKPGNVRSEYSVWARMNMTLCPPQINHVLYFFKIPLRWGDAQYWFYESGLWRVCWMCYCRWTLFDRWLSPWFSLENFCVGLMKNQSVTILRPHQSSKIISKKSEIIHFLVCLLE